MEKTMENVRNHRYIKLVRSEKRRKRLVWETNYYSSKIFSDGNRNEKDMSEKE